MTYGPIYQSTFDSTANVAYSVMISKKNYTGSVTNIKASGSPVVHAWDTDDPKPGIKGSSLRLSFINNGALPITNFYSVEDDAFKVQLFWGTQLLFEGFIVQDDCIEDMIDYTHEITLSATDNLGLLKDVTIDKTPATYYIVNNYVYTIATVAPDAMIVDNYFGSQLLLGDRIKIQGTTVDGTYTVRQLDYDPVNNNWSVHVIEVIGTTAGPVPANITILRQSLTNKITLLSIIKSCVLATGLELPVNIYANIQETTQDVTKTFLDQTFINPDTFLKTDVEYQDCYTVLKNIMERFELTLFQSYGVWNIVRWNDLRYYANSVPGFSYDKTFTATGSVVLNTVITGGIGQDVRGEAVLQNRVFRPFKKAKETFNYKFPVNLLTNYNLKDLGPLISEYTIGTGVNAVTRKEYAFKYWKWDNSYPTSGTAATFFIRIVYDYSGVEIDRYAVVKNNGIHDLAQIEVNQGDSFTWDFTVSSDVSLPLNGPPAGQDANLVFIVKLTDGITTKYLRNPTDINPGWQNGTGWTHTIHGPDNLDRLHTVNIDANKAKFPFDGILTVYLTTITPNPSDETRYKDLRLSYLPYINKSVKVIGHTHENTQTPTIKQSEDITIAMDVSPKNSIAGTLFLESMTGVLRTRASKFKRKLINESLNLGEITTFETLFWRRLPRTIIEGTFRGIVSSTHLSMLSVLKYTGKPGLNFVIGKMEINYRNDQVNCTLWEDHTDTEVDTDLTHTYSFNYLYDTK